MLDITPSVDAGHSFTNPPLNYDNPVNARGMLQVVFLTAEIYNRFNKKYDIDQIVHYEKLREVASLQDVQFLVSLPKGIARLLAPNDEWRFNFVTSAGADLIVNQAPESLFKYTDEACEKAVTAYLKGAEKEDGDATAECLSVPSLYPVSTLGDEKYKIVLGKEYVYIVVREGFAACVADSDSLLAFYRAVLKGMLTKYPIAMVNDTAVFSNYVSLLAS